MHKEREFQKKFFGMIAWRMLQETRKELVRRGLPRERVKAHTRKLYNLLRNTEVDIVPDADYIARNGNSIVNAVTEVPFSRGDRIIVRIPEHLLERTKKLGSRNRRDRIEAEKALGSILHEFSHVTFAYQGLPTVLEEALADVKARMLEGFYVGGRPIEARFEEGRPPVIASLARSIMEDIRARRSRVGYSERREAEEELLRAQRMRWLIRASEARRLAMERRRREALRKAAVARTAEELRARLFGPRFHLLPGGVSRESMEGRGRGGREERRALAA